MAEDELHEAEVESRWEAAPAVLVVIVLQVAIALVSRSQDWTLWRLPWWSWLLLIVPGGDPVRRARAVVAAARRSTSSDAAARCRWRCSHVVGIGNAPRPARAASQRWSAATSTNGGELLYKAVTIWTTNVIAFGLWYWVFDRGGPVRRREHDPPPPDFQFPQMENPELAAPGWHPRLFDYVYLSFTNSVAFSPTDAMPLSRQAKVLMMLEASASADHGAARRRSRGQHPPVAFRRCSDLT